MTTAGSELFPCYRCAKEKAPSLRRLCLACREVALADRKEKILKANHARRLPPRPKPKLPAGWEDTLLDALSEVLFEHNLTMSKVLGASYTNTLQNGPVPTIKKLAPCLSAYDIPLSEVILRWEELIGLPNSKQKR